MRGPRHGSGPTHEFDAIRPLKREPSAELNLAHVAGAADLAERRRRGQAQTGIVQVDDVEHVGHLDAELEHRSTSQREVAEHPEVDVAVAWTVDDAAARAAV